LSSPSRSFGHGSEEPGRSDIAGAGRTTHDDPAGPDTGQCASSHSRTAVRVRAIDLKTEQRLSEPSSSVIIASSNRRANLEFALRSLELQTAPTFDVVVLDDGSTDGTREAINELRLTHAWPNDRLRWVSSGLVPRGLSRARNIGVGNAGSSATHVVTLDADIVLEPGALESLDRATQRHPAAVVFGVVNWLPPDARQGVEGALQEGNVSVLHEFVPEVAPSRIDGTIVGPEPRPAELFASADEALPVPLDPAFALNTFCAIPLSVLRALGGWDEELVGYGYEDMEFGARLQRHGTAALYVADAVGFHVWHPRSKWSRDALDAERNLDYILRRLGADAISDAYADWSIWWHYHRDRGGVVWKIDERHYALNRPRSHALLLPEPSWLSRLGYEPADAQPATEQELTAIEVVGRPRELPTLRVPYVDPLR
jgi:GT2 family glycosyltransferase